MVRAKSAGGGQVLAANCRVIFNRFDTDSVRNIKEAEKLAKAQGRPVAKQADDATPGFLSKAEVRAGLWKCAFPNGNETPKDVKKLINFINVQFKKADMQRKDGKLEFEEFLSMFDECIEEGYILEEHFTQSMAQESQMSAQLAAAKMAAEHAGQDTQFVQNQDLSYLQNVASRTDDEQSKALMDASKGSGMDVVNHGAIGMTAETKARLAAHDGTDNELTAEQKVAKKAAENAGKDTQFVQNQDLSYLQNVAARTDDEQDDELMKLCMASGVDVVHHAKLGLDKMATARLAAHDGTDNELTAEQKLAKKAAENAGKDTQFVQNQDLSGLQKIGSRTDDGDGLATAGGAKAK